jgi:hypothetical protein
MIAYLEKYDTTVDVPNDMGEKEVKDVNDNFHSYVDTKPAAEAPTPASAAPPSPGTPPPTDIEKAQEKLPEQETPKWQPNFYESVMSDLMKPVQAAKELANPESPEAQALGGKTLEGLSFGTNQAFFESYFEKQYKDHPAFAYAGTALGGMGALMASSGIAEGLGLGELATATGKAAVPVWQAGQRFIPQAIMRAGSFGTQAFIRETVKAFEDGHVNLEQFGKDVVQQTAFGAMLGGIEKFANAPASVASAGGLFFILAKMNGADNREAMLQAAPAIAFELVGQVGKSEALRMEALNNLKDSIGEYAQGRNPDLPPEHANAMASAFVDNAMRKAGYPTAEAIAKSGPENLLEGIEKVNQMVRTAQVPHPGEPGEPLPKLPAPVAPEAPAAATGAPSAPEAPKGPLDKAIETVKGMMGIKPAEPAAPLAPAPPTIEKSMKDIGDRLTIHGLKEPEKEAIFSQYAEKLPDQINKPIEEQYQDAYKTLAAARGITSDKPDAATMDQAEKAVDLINDHFNPKSQELFDFAKAHPEASVGEVAQMAHNRGMLDSPNPDLLMSEMKKASQEKIATHPMFDPNRESPTFLHGTSILSLDKILRDGELRPSISRDEDNFLKTPAVSLSRNPMISGAFGNILFHVDKTKLPDAYDADIVKEHPGIEQRVDRPIPLSDIKRVTIQMGTQEGLDYKFGNSKTIGEYAEEFKKRGIPVTIEGGKNPLSSESGAVMIPPDLVDVANHIRESSEEIRNLVAPANAAPLAAQITRANLGKMARSYDMAEASLSDASKLFEKQPKEANIDFIDKMERGQSQADPKLQPFADKLRDLLDTKRAEIQTLGTGKLKAFNENYFPHIWDQGEKEVGAAVQKGAKRPFEGSKAFLKARTIEFTKEGVEAGLTPVSYNPVDLTLLKMREMDKYIMAHQTLNEFKENGLAQFVKVGGDIPEGWQKIDDRISTVMFKGDQGLTISGHIYAQPDAARIINNYLSPGLQNSKIFQAYRYAGNLMNQFQLSMSAFHLGFVGLEGSVSKLSLAIRELSQGHPLNAIKDAIKTPFAPIATVIRGDQMLKAWRGEGKSGVDNILATTMAQGGGRARMDQFYATRAYDQMKHYFETGRAIKGILTAPLAALDLSMKPTLEYYVPRMKLGAFADIMEMEMRNNPNMTHDETRQIAQRAWDSIDNRFGQLVYDNLFWNRTFKDLLMASQRSVGWNLGTIRELGGGVIDAMKQPFEGKNAEVTDKMGHLIALPILVGALGAMIQYLKTGKGPQTLKDYYFPQTGGMDAAGDPHRSALPSYMKDIYHYTQDPLKTITNKLSPLLSTISEMLENKDYYGTKIHNEDDPLVKQAMAEAMFLAKQLTPFSIRNMQKNLETGNRSLFDTVGPWVGITPAPYDIDQTKAEKAAHEIMMSHQAIGGRTEEQAQRSHLLSELTRNYKMGDPNAVDHIQEAYQKGLISHKQMQDVIVHAGMTPLQRMVKGMTLEEAERVYGKANDEEKAQIGRMVERKRETKEKEYVQQP